MARKTWSTTAFLRGICALFMLVCILFFAIPHTHHCTGNHCPLCELKESFLDALPVICFFGSLLFAASRVVGAVYFGEQSALYTLVQLKVKLSN